MLRKGYRAAEDLRAKDDTNKNQIRQKLRFLARLRKEISSLVGECNEFCEILKPSYYDTFVQAVLNIRENNKQLAFTLGNYIKELCMLNIGQCIKQKGKGGQKKRKEDTDDFLQLYNSSWTSLVSASTVRLQRVAQISRKEELPPASDMQTFTKFLCEQILEETEKEVVQYVRLQKLVMAKLIAFNGRRPAEVADLNVGDFRLAVGRKDDRQELMDSLEPEEKAIAQR